MTVSNASSTASTVGRLRGALAAGLWPRRARRRCRFTVESEQPSRIASDSRLSIERTFTTRPLTGGIVSFWPGRSFYDVSLLAQ